MALGTAALGGGDVDVADFEVVFLAGNGDGEFIKEGVVWKAVWRFVGVKVDALMD